MIFLILLIFWNTAITSFKQYLTEISCWQYKLISIKTPRHFTVLEMSHIRVEGQKDLLMLQSLSSKPRRRRWSFIFYFSITFIFFIMIYFSLTLTSFNIIFVQHLYTMNCCTHHITVQCATKKMIVSFDSMHKRKQCTHLITFFILFYYIFISGYIQ